MLQQFRANVGINLKFYRRNRLLAGAGLLFIAMSLLYVGGAILFSTSTGRFDLTRSLFDQLTYFAFIFIAAVGLLLIAVQVRGKGVKLVFTKPCPLEVWLGSAFGSAMALALFLYATILAITFLLSVVWHIPFQSGFVFMSVEFMFEAISAMAYLSFLSMIIHPVIAVMIAVVFNESVFFMMRMGLIAAIKNTGGSIALPLLEKLTYGLYMIIPMFTPYQENIASIKASFRVSANQWQYLGYTAAYALTLTALFYLLTLIALKRKNFV